MTPETAQYFYAQVASVDRCDERAHVMAVLESNNILAEILAHSTADEHQLFADLYSRLVFVADKHHLADYLQHQLHALRLLAGKCRKQPGKEVTREQVAGCLRALCLLVFHFSNEPVPVELREFYMLFPPLHYAARTYKRKELVPFVRAAVVSIAPGDVVDGKYRRCVVTCKSEELGTIKVVLWQEWSELEHSMSPYATLHLFALQKLSDDQDMYATTSNSLVVLEPDFLIDATDIAECFQYNGANPNLYLLKKFICVDPSEAILLGNIANFCFDELIANIDSDFDAAFASAVRQKPLAVVALLRNNPHLLAVLRGKAHEYFHSVRSTLARLRYSAASTEPTFISSDYGLQGRLDLLLEYDDDEFRKDVVELKSGSPASTPTGLWRNHIAQVTCYNMLLDSCFEQRSGSSSILYLRATENTLRNAPNILQLKQEVIALRNKLVAMEYALTDRKFQALKRITPAAFGPAPSYTSEHIRRFADALALASGLERKYFYVFNSFVAREHWSAKAGGEQNFGFSSLWRKSLVEKEQQYEALARLQLDRDNSDFQRLHLSFQRSEHTIRVSTFRTGDIVLLYPMGENGEAHPLRHQILKGSIKELTPDRVVVSLRNKQLRTEMLENAAEWVVEHDFLASGYKSMHESLYDLLSAPPAIRQLLLGLERPQFDELAFAGYDELTDEQNALLLRAVSARNYFLLQGPPGTGKTSRMLRSMVQYIHENSSENIVVLAFTNRAVDEICDAIKRIEPSVPFIRLGTKDSTTHTDAVLTEILGDGTLHELAATIDRTRVVVATVSSLLKNRELLRIKHFTTAIVDEASQIVEPQIIGLLAQFERFILIGDEKQLPSVVTQQECGIKINDADLNAIGVRDLRMSLFERLLLLNMHNGNSDAYGMISRQGRMHSVIQEFPNRAFYGGQLSCLGAWQQDSQHVLNFSNSSDPLADMLSLSRLLFIPSAREFNVKIHHQEAQRTARLIEFIRNNCNGEFSASTVGVITPYRAQIATIASYLPPEARDLVTIDTVERYQGSERDIIILSLAANHPAQLRTMQSLTADGLVDRKLNVALTRARHQLIVLGCPDVLMQEPIFRDFIGFVREHGGYVDDWPEVMQEN